VLWWGEHDAEEHMIGQEHHTFHRPHMLSLRQPQCWGDARLETGQHHQTVDGTGPARAAQPNGQQREPGAGNGTEDRRRCTR